MTDLTRRAALAAPAALVGAPALAGLAPLAAPLPPERPDPALAAFERWRAAYISYRHVAEKAGRCPHPIPAELDAESLASSHREVEALKELANTPPTSLAGLAALLRGLAYEVSQEIPKASGLEESPLDPLDWRPEDFEPEGDGLQDHAARGVWRAVMAAEHLAAQDG